MQLTVLMHAKACLEAHLGGGVVHLPGLLLASFDVAGGGGGCTLDARSSGVGICLQEHQHIWHFASIRLHWHLCIFAIALLMLTR